MRKQFLNRKYIVCHFCGNRKHIFKRICYIVLLPLLVCCFLYTTRVDAKKETLLVKYVKQQKSNWCWAASAENSVRYERKINRTQKDAVKKIKGWVLNTYPNIGGTTKDIKEAAEYISKGKENYSYVKRQESYNFLKRQIHIQNVSVITYGYYKDNDKKGGHAVAVIGYNDDTGEIQVYDPAVNGGKKWYSYKKLKNGDLFFDGLKAKYETTIFNLDR